MEIIVAKNAGFCFGVKKALEMTNKAIEENLTKQQGSDVQIYTYGPLIHNPLVVEELRQKGVNPIDDLSQAEGKKPLVIIRSHGAPKKLYDEANQKGITLLDATCPYVKKVQNIAKKHKEEGYHIIIVGDKNHPEVIGINGWCDDTATIIDDDKECVNIGEDNLCIVAQTTIKEEIFKKIVEKLKKIKKNIIIFQTICEATKLRQKSCEETAKRCNAMVVIGGKNSSNTQKLFAIAEKNCKKTFFVERKEDLPLNQVEKCNKIGVTAGASTPECIIKEVISIMSEFITDQMKEAGAEENQMFALMDEIEKSLRMPGRGEIVNGDVITVNEREVVINLGCKKDGIIPKDEVSLEPGQKLTDLFKVGETVEAKVVKTKDDEGNILLSKKKLEVNEHWNEINEALENKSFVNAKVIGKVKGGVIAAYKEITGFIPLSHISDRFTENVDEYIGKTLPVMVIQLTKNRNRAVFSHKEFLAIEKAKKMEEVWGSIHVDDIVEGTVKRFTDYGAFVDIGGVDGLLHISEISWGKIKKPQDVLKLEETLKVKVLSMNQEKGKISLGLKQTMPEPWENIEEKYNVSDVIQGNVVQLKDYGAFIEIEPGLDGLVHISEIAYKRVQSPANELTIGQEVSAKILEIDKEKKRISLSIKETLDKPEEDDYDMAPAEEADQEEIAVEEVVEETTDEETTEV